MLGQRGGHKDAPHVSRAPVAMVTGRLKVLQWLYSVMGGLSRCENLSSAELSWVRAESSWTSV